MFVNIGHLPSARLSSCTSGRTNLRLNIRIRQWSSPLDEEDGYYYDDDDDYCDGENNKDDGEDNDEHVDGDGGDHDNDNDDDDDDLLEHSHLPAVPISPFQRRWNSFFVSILQIIRNEHCCHHNSHGVMMVEFTTTTILALMILTNLPTFEHPHLPRSASPLVFTNPGWDTESVLQTAPPGSIHKIMVMKKRSGSVKMLTCAKVTGNHYDSMIYEVNGSKARLRTNLLITTSPPDAHKRRGSAHNHWGCLSHKLKGVRW